MTLRSSYGRAATPRSSYGRPSTARSSYGRNIDIEAPVDVDGPTPPVITDIVASHTQKLVVTYTPGTDPSGIDYTEYQLSTDGGSTWGTANVFDEGTSEIGGLSAGTVWTVRMRHVDTVANVGAWSNEYTAITEPNPTQLEAAAPYLRFTEAFPDGHWLHDGGYTTGPIASYNLDTARDRKGRDPGPTDTATATAVTDGNLGTAVSAASDGDVLLLAAGTWTEAGTITVAGGKTVTIVGALDGSTVFDGELRFDGAGTLRLENVRHNGYTTAVTSGVAIIETDGLMLRHVTIVDGGAINVKVPPDALIIYSKIGRGGQYNLKSLTTAGDAARAVILYSEFWGGNIGRYDLEPGAVPENEGMMKFTKSPDVVIEGCWSHDNYGSQFWADVSENDAALANVRWRLAYNLAESSYPLGHPDNVTEEGYFLELGSAVHAGPNLPIAEYNIARWLGKAGFALHDCPAIARYNVVIDCDNALSYRVSERPGLSGRGLGGGMVDMRFIHATIRHSGTPSGQQDRVFRVYFDNVAIDGVASVGLNSGNVIDHNDVETVGAGNWFYYRPADSTGLSWTDMASWEAEISADYADATGWQLNGTHVTTYAGPPADLFGGSGALTGQSVGPLTYATLGTTLDEGSGVAYASGANYGNTVDEGSEDFDLAITAQLGVNDGGTHRVGIAYRAIDSSNLYLVHLHRTAAGGSQAVRWAYRNAGSYATVPGNNHARTVALDTPYELRVMKIGDRMKIILGGPMFPDVVGGILDHSTQTLHPGETSVGILSIDNTDTGVAGDRFLDFWSYRD